jgi:hypothetical protein
LYKIAVMMSVAEWAGFGGRDLSNMDALLWDDADGSGRLAEGRNRAMDLTSPSLPLGVLVGYPPPGCE